MAIYFQFSIRRTQIIQWDKFNLLNVIQPSTTVDTRHVVYDDR